MEVGETGRETTSTKASLMISRDQTGNLNVQILMPLEGGQI